MSNRLLATAGVVVTLGVVVGAANLGAAAPPSPAPVQIVGTLELEGIKGGEGADNAIEIRSFDFGASRAVSASQPKFKEIRVVKAIDASSPKLLQRLATANPITKAKVSIYRVFEGEQPLEPVVYKRYTLTKVYVTSVRHYASGQGRDIPLEEVALNVATKVEVSYLPPEAPAISFCWKWTGTC